ncbi:methyl-accepting chemotaxis protein [Bacteriovorax sp. PP10]|uniref:Methyl-accepting chemotaxis protein n=1 Tax=Bacteriovorax antarcticus TaxID=3088717 RepID=A0ABU5VV79_9BACT|nr:methyl-accepting chemotaxis protein [Bacteriovorax sp. PP10]MEA9356965.1 methyl-accepting chemotaxis protein [Bacteriovorax sp. PP10]
MKNFSIKAKLLMLSAFLVSVSIVLGAVSYWSMNKVIKDFSVVTDTSYPNTSLMLEMYSNYRSARLQVMILNSNAGLEGKEAAIKSFKGSLTSDAEFQKKYMEVEFLPGEDVIYSKFRAGLDKGFNLFQQAMTLLESGKKDPETQAKIDDLINNKIVELAHETRTSSTALKEFHMGQAKHAAESAKESGANATKIIVTLIIVMGSIGFAAAFFFSNSLVGTLKQISDALDESSAQVSSAAGQIASSSEELSQAATEQASSLEETSSSVEEMSSMVNINTENAKKASENSEISKRQAERGRTVVTEMVHSMSQINESNNNIMTQINHSNDQMGEIVKVIQEIETKTKVINDIVFQTKLLSFNASVEAARAGEQGKGFAVVAEEVGNLAQMSGNAAKEISEMLASSVHKVESIVQETKSKVDVLIADGKEKVAAGTKVAEECGEVLAEIVINVTSVATMASEISNASFEQSKGIQEITKAMGQLDQVTQTNAATSEEAASAAEELSSQASSLKTQVLLLVATINGTAAPTDDSVVRSTPTKPTMNKSTPTAKVMPFKAPAKKSAPAAKVAHARHEAAPAKKAAGGSLPSYDHPGFEEV